jgi:hypothetical protein
VFLLDIEVSDDYSASKFNPEIIGSNMTLR